MARLGPIFASHAVASFCTAGPSSNMQKTHIDYCAKAFDVDTNALIPLTLGVVEKGVLSKLVQKTLPTCYATLLLREGSFQQSMQLSIGTPMILWFEHFLEDTLERGCSKRFDEACQKLQFKLFEITIKSFQKRKSDSYSFEFGLHELHRSELFAELCWGSMPGRLADDHAGCSILCTVLAEIHLRWVKDALRQDRRTRNPEHSVWCGCGDQLKLIHFPFGSPSLFLRVVLRRSSYPARSWICKKIPVFILR